MSTFSEFEAMASDTYASIHSSLGTRGANHSSDPASNNHEKERRDQDVEERREQGNIASTCLKRDGP